MKSIIALLALALTGSGCSDDITKSKSSHNSPTNNAQTNNALNNPVQTNNTSTNNSPIIPVEGEVVLKVVQAQQASATSYALSVQVANGLEESISISPSVFRLGVGGLELTSVNLSKSTCPAEALISAGASHSCVLHFDEVEADPDRLIYVGAGDPVVATFTVTACETCGTESCVDLRSDLDHCGSCNKPVGGNQTCNDGIPECEQDARVEQGFCIPNDEGIELRPLPLDSQQSCYEICDFQNCEGVMGRTTCGADDPFGGAQAVYPGIDFCESTGADIAGFAPQFGCTIEALFCTCY